MLATRANANVKTSSYVAATALLLLKAAATTTCPPRPPLPLVVHGWRYGAPAMFQRYVVVRGWRQRATLFRRFR